MPCIDKNEFIIKPTILANKNLKSFALLNKMYKDTIIININSNEPATPRLPNVLINKLCAE